MEEAMTEEIISREPALGFVLLGKQTLIDALDVAGKHGVLAVVALLWYADNDTGICYPSLTALAKRAGLQLRTLRDALRKLQESGLLTWVDRSDEGKSHLFTISQTIHIKSSGGVAKSPGGIAKSLGGGIAKSLPELDSTTTIPRTSKDTMSDLVFRHDQFFDLYGRKDTSRRLSEAAWMRAFKRGNLPEQKKLLDQVERYRLHTFKGRPESVTGQFLKHPDRWLDKECYLSEYPDTYQGGPGSGGRLQPAYDPGEAGEEPAF